MQVLLLPALIDLCDDHGRRHAAAYASGRSSSALSTRGVEKDPVALSLARQGECAVAVCLGLDPLKVLKWTDGHDAGFDLPHNGLRVDVKRTKPGGQYLIYPANKTARFKRHVFDILVLVRGERGVFDVVGWTTKRWFAKHHQVEPDSGNGKGPHGLDAGTWFMPADQLFRMQHLDIGRVA